MRGNAHRQLRCGGFGCILFHSGARLARPAKLPRECTVARLPVADAGAGLGGLTDPPTGLAPRNSAHASFFFLFVAVDLNQ